MLRVLGDRFDPPEFDTAVSSALLHRVASGDEPPTLRVWVPGRAVAFGRQDTVRPGYHDAVAAAAALGFAPVERLAGGRAAVFHEETIAFSWAMPDDRARDAITERFAAMSGLVAAALRSLGCDARVGEVDGEYCPGEWSVNLSGERKVMGVGQRLIRGGAHVGGVIVVGRPDLVNLPLAPVYRALDYAWRPAATGAMTQADPGITTDAVAAAMVEAFREAGHDPEHASMTPDTLTLAATLTPSPR